MARQKQLWKFNRITGYWSPVRSVTDETAPKWLAIFQRDEPSEYFTISARRPSHNPQGDFNAQQSDVVARVTDKNGVRWTIVETRSKLDSPFRAEVVSDRAPYAPSLAADSVSHAKRRITEYARGAGGSANRQRGRLFGASHAARTRDEDILRARAALLDTIEKTPKGVPLTPEREASARALVGDRLAFIEEGRIYATNRGEKAARSARRFSGNDWYTYMLVDDLINNVFD